MSRRSPQFCCWCGALAAAPTFEHLLPRSTGLKPRTWLLGSMIPWACGPCNRARSSTLGPPPGVSGGPLTALWNQGMAYWITAALPRLWVSARPDPPRPLPRQERLRRRKAMVAAWRAAGDS